MDTTHERTELMLLEANILRDFSKLSNYPILKKNIEPKIVIDNLKN